MFRRLVAATLLILGMCAVAIAQPIDGIQDDSPYVRIEALVNESVALSLPVRVERAFRLSLNGAGDAIRQGDYARALTLLRTFVFEVRSVKRARRIQAGAADPLIEKAEQLIATMSGPAPR